MVCGRVLICDEGDFKENSVVCPRCNPKLQEKRGAGIGASIISLINNLIQPNEQQQIFGGAAADLSTKGAVAE
jgi:hypothetical protein